MSKKRVMKVLVAMLGIILLFTLGNALLSRILAPPLALTMPESALAACPTLQPLSLPESIPEMHPEETQTAAIEYAQPTRMVYDAIGLDADVDAVGMDDDAMGVIPSNEIISWFNLSCNPGEQGNVILAAHRNWKREPGPFYHLDKCTVGDTASITDASGTIWHYMVDSIEIIDYINPPSYVMDSGGDERVTLITCTGTYNSQYGTAEQRIVVILKPA